MESYIVINGKRAELTEEQLKALGIATEKKSVFSRREEDEEYFYIDCYGNAAPEYETCHDIDSRLFAAANYCTDKNLLQQRAWLETLNRLLWRYSMEHKGKRIDDKVWSISYHRDTNTFHAGWINYQVTYVGETTFDTEEIAENAIKEIVEPFMQTHPDFKP